ncbi:12402_t:CDS:1, partial [Dentiscutata heterogama]
EYIQTEQQKKLESLKITVNKLNKRVHDKYWSTVSSEDIERTE